MPKEAGHDALAEFRRKREARRQERLQYTMSSSRETRFQERRAAEEASRLATALSSAPAVSSGGASVRERDASSKISGALTFRQLVNLFLSVGIEQKTAVDIIESNHDVGLLPAEKADLFKQVLRDALGVLEAEGVPQDIFKSRAEESAATTSGEQKVRIRVNLCKICKDTAAITATYPQVMVSYFRRHQRFRGELTEHDWLCKGCYGSWYGDNHDFVKELQQAEEEQRQQLIAEAVSKSGTADENGDDDEDDEEDVEARVQKELYVKAIAYPLYMMTISIEEKALQHRKFLTRALTLGKIRLIQLPAALRYLRKHPVVDEDDFEHICGVGRWAESFAWTGWNEAHTATELLKVDAALRAKSKAEKLADREHAARAERLEKEAADKEAERERELIASRRDKAAEVEETAISEKRAKLKDQRERDDAKLKRQRQKEEQDRQRNREQHMEEEKRETKRRAQELKVAEERVRAREASSRLEREDRARRLRREREQKNREAREAQQRLEEQFRKEAAERRERERERRKLVI